MMKLKFQMMKKLIFKLNQILMNSLNHKLRKNLMKMKMKMKKKMMESQKINKMEIFCAKLKEVKAIKA